MRHGSTGEAKPPGSRRSSTRTSPSTAAIVAPRMLRRRRRRHPLHPLPARLQLRRSPRRRRLRRCRSRRLPCPPRFLHGQCRRSCRRPPSRHQTRLRRLRHHRLRSLYLVDSRRPKRRRVPAHVADQTAVAAAPPPPPPVTASSATDPARLRPDADESSACRTHGGGSGHADAGSRGTCRRHHPPPHDSAATCPSQTAVETPPRARRRRPLRRRRRRPRLARRSPSRSRRRRRSTDDRGRQRADHGYRSPEGDQGPPLRSRPRSGRTRLRGHAERDPDLSRRRLALPPTEQPTDASCCRASARQPVPTPWAAITVAKDFKRWGMSWHEDTRRAALAGARARCGSDECVAAVSFSGHHCGAFALSPSGWSITWRDDEARARDAALSICKQKGPTCEIIGAVCADGSGRSSAARTQAGQSLTPRDRCVASVERSPHQDRHTVVRGLAIHQPTL